jgi:hydrogenase/urease accessory protein HupE
LLGFRLCLVSFGLALALPSRADAHAMRSVLVEIEERGPGRASVHLRSSVPEAPIAVALEGCTLAFDDDAAEAPAAAADRVAAASCSDGALAGHAVSARGLGPVLSEAVVWIRQADGTTASHLLSRDEPSWTLPTRGGAVGVARQYVSLGVAHILTGWDHLLFLVLLVLTLRRPRAVLLAETAFTASHAISFTATALGWIHVSPPAAETCIALSLVLVALDVGSGERPRALAGAGLAFVFGLVHGLGFAGGLSEVGLPDRDVGVALLGFASGVEIGQVAFLAVVLFVVHFAERLRAWPRVAIAGAYASGGLATSWLIERALACFGFAG